MRSPILTSAVLLALAATPATSQDLFSADQEACFGRVYDRAHLAGHPRQRTLSLHVLRSLGPRPGSELWHPRAREEAIKRYRESGESAVAAFVAFRDRAGHFHNTLICSKEGHDGVVCAVECDGGSFRLRRESANTALLTNNGFVLIGGCGEEVEDAKTIHFDPGSDDKVFRLESKPIAVCRAEEQKVNPIPAGKPLRERFKENEAFCFGRDYDAAHLAGNPRQMVASLRVGRLDPAAEKADSGIEWWWYNVKLDVSLTLRNGSQVGDTRYSCYPEDGAWACRREATSGTPSACDDRSIRLVRGPGDDILVQNRHSGLPIDRECETAPTGEQLPVKPLTRSDDRSFRLTRMPIEACRSAPRAKPR